MNNPNLTKACNFVHDCNEQDGRATSPEELNSIRAKICTGHSGLMSGNYFGFPDNSWAELTPRGFNISGEKHERS